MPQKKLKIVFDCNVYLQSFLSVKGTASKCKKLAVDGLIELFISQDKILMRSRSFSQT